jgi:hypothetical protein
MKQQKTASIYLLIYLLTISSAFSQPLKSPFSKKNRVEIKTYEVVDIAFTLKKMPAGNPFDVTFGAVFSKNNNSDTKISGFYNGNNEWIIRFSSSTIGNQNFTTYSSVPELSGLTGNVAITANPDKNQHGAVTINSKAPQYFIYEDSTSYFSLAFELDWLFALDCNNKTDIPKTRQLISAVKENGFNQVVINVFAYDVQWKTEQNLPEEYEYRKPSCFPFKGNNENPDFSELNPEFFKHFDRVVQHLNEQGIVAHIMIYVWNKKVNWPEMYSKADNNYFDYVINRYQAYSNIIWDVSKEALDYGRCDINYINERIGRIRKNDAFKRLVTVHDYEYCSREPEKVDFISVQNWRSGLFYQMIDIRNKHINKPIVNIEHGGYEAGSYLSFPGNYSNAETCLIRNYECVFAGVYSTYYWQNSSWNIVVYDPFNKSKGLVQPHFDYYKHMAGLFKKYDFNTLFSTKAKLTTNSKGGLENLSSSGYALTNGKNLFLYLVLAESEQINTTIPKPQNGQIEASWFNPFTGEYSEKVTLNWTGWQEFKSPWEKTTSVLIIGTN